MERKKKLYGNPPPPLPSPYTCQSGGEIDRTLSCAFQPIEGGRHSNVLLEFIAPAIELLIGCCFKPAPISIGSAPSGAEKEIIPPTSIIISIPWNWWQRICPSSSSSSNVVAFVQDLIVLISNICKQGTGARNTHSTLDFRVSQWSSGAGATLPALRSKSWPQLPVSLQRRRSISRGPGRDVAIAIESVIVELFHRYQLISVLIWVIGCGRIQFGPVFKFDGGS